MDLRKIKKLIELLEDSNLQEMEIQEGEESIRLSRGGSGAPSYAPVQMPASVPAPLVDAAPAATTATNETSAGDEINLDDAITSPMVGTFYSASKPGEPDFVKVGDTVSAGDVLCIVEAMKIFNQIEADRSGKIVSVLKDSGDPVEYGEPLFIIE